MSKVAFITGITGQDGYYLTKLLLQHGYIVHGMVRRSSQLNTQRLEPFYQDLHMGNLQLILHYGDMTDAMTIVRLINEIQPNEVYNLAAMSHVQVSFEMPEYTTQVDAVGALHVLNACKLLTNGVRYYQAGTSEMFGGLFDNAALTETSPFNPRSPYAIAKVYAHQITKNYRESYGMFCCNGILFNHTSIHRGHNFVEQKIVKAAVAIRKNYQSTLYLGNLYAKRDIGHAEDYVRAMYLMLQQDTPDDYVIATGITNTIKDIVNFVFRYVFNDDVVWSGNDIDEIGSIGTQIMVRIDKKYFRPSEVEVLLGNASKAKTRFNWSPVCNVYDILREMIDYEMMPE